MSAATSRRGVLRLGAAAPLVLVAVTPSPAAMAGNPPTPLPHPDAALLALGAVLLAAREAEARAWMAVDAADAAGDEEGPLWQAADAAQEHALGIAQQVEACTATSLAGLLVKARALACCRAGDPVTLEVIAPDYRPGCHTTDIRLVVGLLRDLTAMTEVLA